MPRAPDPGAKTNLRGVAAHAARWGGAGRTTGIGFLHSPSLQRAPSNPPALGPRSRGTQGSHTHTRRPRELAGAVGEVATPCTDGRPPENTPPWLGLHQSSLPNAAKGYPPREPREPRPLSVKNLSKITLSHSRQARHRCGLARASTITIALDGQCIRLVGPQIARPRPGALWSDL